jgi:hypothetical protein
VQMSVTFYWREEGGGKRGEGGPRVTIEESARVR